MSIREINVINVIRAHIETANAGVRDCQTVEGTSAALQAVAALAGLARELSKASDAPDLFLEKCGVSRA